VSSHHSNEPLDQLIRRADEALYRGKAQGRDQVVLATG
jgi:PleD family two-component response regulator